MCSRSKSQIMKGCVESYIYNLTIFGGLEIGDKTLFAAKEKVRS